MPSYTAIRDRLPSLYRPQPEAGPGPLFVRMLRAVGERLDEVDEAAGDTMQAHWLELADRALYSPWFRRARALGGKPEIALDDPALEQFPFVADLARLAALLPLSPWREPPAQRELVEAFRQRIRRIVALYSNGLGTVPALRAMIEAQLPVDLSAPPPLRDRPFALEEFAPVPMPALAAPSRGAPADLVGPLMRWRVTNDGVAPVAPVVYVQGVAPQPDQVDACEDPVVELFSAGRARVRVGISYKGTLAPGQTLRLRPSYSSWLGGPAGLLRTESRPGEAPADPTAPGPWQAAPGAPAGVVKALEQTRDAMLWAAVDNGDAGALWRFDGATWTEIVTQLPNVHCLARDGDTLLAGTAKGLLRLVLYPPDSDTPRPRPEPQQLDALAVQALLRARDGTWWAGTARGLAKLGAGDALEPFVLGADAATRVSVHALHQDRTGTLYLGTARGVFQHQPFTGDWYWYSGRESSDQRPDWRPFAPELPPARRGFPVAADVFLPPVRSLLRGRDASLWLGTDEGIARYVARPVDGLAYTTLLEAFPDITTGRVHRIVEDERGQVWFACAQGVLRFDGRDWWQVRGGALARLGASGTLGRHWRFNRATGRWESAERRAGTSVWTPFAGAARATNEKATLTLAWTDGVVADLGGWDGDAFSADAGAQPGPLGMRYKPDERRIVDGGLPAVPRLPAGASVWRYLKREGADAPAPKTLPAWTSEGRLLPPPEEQAAPQEGRHGAKRPLDLSDFDDAVYAYNPAARVWLAWEPRRPLSVLARIATLKDEAALDPAVIDRVWEGLEQVRPAGVRALLAVDEEIVKGR